ncbi:catenin delta-2-like isoform X3 [Lytechinus variegatus]|uniref:catenin delta-2-like isoform X3 n=1 Tax=Lytechinus variegatus TaxID=7654 RepID=UPI001BB0FA75|nr:catenin delta-2-like isoform X3 [Lytechinus variegatus]
MPGWDDGNSQTLTYSSQKGHDYSSDYPNTILKSVKEQEAQFAQLTREFEADKLIAANQINRSRVDSDTATLNSISETNDSFSWRRSAGQTESHMDEGSSFVVDVPSTNLLDSCLRELGERNVEDPNMESLQYSDPYASPYGNTTRSLSHDPYGGGDYAPHPYDAGSQGYDRQSDYGSPHHSNYQEYPPSESGQGGYGYADPPPPSNDDYNGYSSDTKPRDSFREVDPRVVEMEDPYGTRDRFDGAGDDAPYRAPSPIGPDPYSSLPKTEDPYQSSSGYREYAHTPPPAVISPIQPTPPSGVDDYGNPWDDYPLTSDPEVAPSDAGQEASGVNPRDNYDHPRPATSPGPKEDPYVSSRQPYDDYADNRGHDPDLNDRSPAGTLDRTPSHDPFIPPEKAQFIFRPSKYLSGHYHHHLPTYQDLLSRKSSRSSLSTCSFGDGKWRAPDLQEVIDYLGHPNQSIVAHAAGYIQHLSYQNDDIKRKTREMGGIQPLVGLLGNPVPEIHRTACGSLRNLSYGKKHEENKVKIKANGGIPALARLLRTSSDTETKDLAAGTLWNLSSSEPLKKTILEDALSVLVNNVLIPESGWKPSGNSPFKPADEPWTKTFINATGCLRNVSSGGIEARHRMRECEGLVDSLLHVLSSSMRNNDMDSQVVENTLCILRNLTFRIANEANHPDAIPLRSNTSSNFPDTMPKSQQKKSPQSGSLICFGGSKKKDAQLASNGTAGKTGTWNPSQPIPNLKKDVKGVEKLWQPSIINPYLIVLSECSRPASLEAAAGTIQNVTAGEWQWAMYIRAEMRKEKGLPILVELLRMKNDRVMIAVAKALRNLAMDPRNKDLIGKYGMQDLVERLPSSTSSRRSAKDISHEGVVAVLNTMTELVTKNQENAKSLRGASGIERLVSLTKTNGAYPASVIKAAYQVLHAMWAYKDLRPQYKKDGWEEKFFHASSTFTTLPRKTTVDGSLPPTASESKSEPTSRTNTVQRHTSKTNSYDISQPTRPAPELSDTHRNEAPPAFDDPYPMNTGNQPMYDERSVDRDFAADRLADNMIPGEEIPMQPLSSDYADNPYASTGRKSAPIGGVSVYGRAPEPQVEHSNYASVNQSMSHDSYDRSKDYGDYSTAQHVQLQAQDEPAGDSWV